jgi:Ca-activated chloride channel family protein
MKWINYSRFTEEDLGIDAEDLLQALSDFFLQSGYQDPYFQYTEFNSQTLDDLRRALERALEEGNSFDNDRAEEIRQKLQQMTAEQRERLLKRLIEKLEEAGYIHTEGVPDEAQAPGAEGGAAPEVHFEVTDKAIDFLGV